MSRHQALSEWVGNVSMHLPHLSKPHATVLALWSFGMVLTRSCGITTVAAFLAGLMGKKEDTVRQQLREWCYDAPHKKSRYKDKGTDKGSGQRQRTPGSRCKWLFPLSSAVDTGVVVFRRKEVGSSS